jgi:hypothetical protein
MAVVIADPKAILARKGGVVISRDPKVVAKARAEQEKARQFRIAHGLSTGPVGRTER